ncbi:MAG: L-seryl-tRNA(Sec) selenium transferase [Chthoniobacteraceae bacterium]
MKAASRLRAIPSVEKLVQALGPLDVPRPLVVAAARREVAALRGEKALPEFDDAVRRVTAAVEDLRRSRIQPVINGTGILAHTNFGRAPLGEPVVAALSAVASEYNNLEYDIATGGRGDRAAYLEQCLAALCGAEAATVVNNCAAALVLTLRHFTKKKPEVIISRGELIQIGGGFRIPEILEASGARLREIGTTNKTTLADYKRAIGADTAMILKVHRSNFFMRGFVESAETTEIAEIARKRRVPLVEDLGSGAIAATEKLAVIAHEPTPAEVLKRGVDLVMFSGDKLLGGPQAGILAGRARHIAALKRDPFYRALRCDKLILAALQTTAELYLSGAHDSVPMLAMLRVSTNELRARCEKLVAALAGLPLAARVGGGNAQVGGGTLPQSEIPSITLDLMPAKLPLDELAARLRTGTPPVIGYISARRFKLDLRTIFPRHDARLAESIRTASAR